MLWTYLSPASLSELFIDAVCLEDILGMHAVLPEIHEMTLNIDASDIFAFAEIETATPSVSAIDLASFVVDMHIDSGVLDELVFENVAVEGDIAGVAVLVRGL
ncbi:hypothetical protein EXIGLDRAFT_778160 [Exidia glandulosa HHB12029]|uniref:Uncharacterized protein n=1 Tax=Exidia glandulosa HHB12029 TaxID=1314781 RepID=A0A165CNY1_EXIGL|nr:hypothetical protein EXIGLDRAFT_778160 [Exidia glandulosa HHB12029]